MNDASPRLRLAADEFIAWALARPGDGRWELAHGLTIANLLAAF
ncbi:MAG TPA: hypothetical protein VMB71_15230 [Acetobacteraceae bacterium]|nr:hypothetical protein [Acetobacteraceae bacterium]